MGHAALYPLPDRMRSARLWLLVMLMFGLVELAAAGAFDTPIITSDFDTANFSQYVDGTTSQITSLTPADLVTTTTTAPGDLKELVYGDTKNPGARHVRIAFTAAKTVKTILVYSESKVSVLSSSASYPGNMANESDWIPCERLDGASVVTSEPKVTAMYNLNFPRYAVWVVPASVTSTRAIRFTHDAPRSDWGYMGRLRGVHIFSSRFANIAPQCKIATPCNPQNTKLMTNEVSDWQDVWHAGPPPTPITASTPVTLTLVWPSNVTLRGLCGLQSNFSAATVEYFSGTGHPSESSPSGWTTIGNWTGVQYGDTRWFLPNFYDFGSDITTRAIRVKITTPSAGATNVALIELFALKSLASNALSTAVVSATTTNPPIPVTFSLASAGYVSLVIDDNTGKRVRNLIKEQYFPAGTNTVYWDGLDESQRAYRHPGWTGYKTSGKLVAPGTYRVRGLVRPALTLAYEMSPYTGNTVPWFTIDRTGGWLADQNAPKAVVFIPTTNQVVIGSNCAEQGNNFAWVNLSGQLQYGVRGYDGNTLKFSGANFLTRDVGTDAQQKESGIQLYFASYFYDNGRTLKLWAVDDNRAGGSRTYSYTYPDKHADNTDFVLAANRPNYGGLAVRHKLAAISLTQADSSTGSKNYGQIAMVDASTGSVYRNVDLADPRGVAFDSNGKLVVITGTSVKRYTVNSDKTLTQDGSFTTITGLLDPRGLCLDSNNDIYVSDWGTSHQVKAYSANGTFVRVIGTASSGLAVGTYDPNKMVNPSGLTISDNAGTKRLWVAEDGGDFKRVGVWSLTGTLDTALTKYGPPNMGSAVTIDPNDATMSRAYMVGWNCPHGFEFNLNWTNGTWALQRIYSIKENEAAQLPGPAPRVPIYANGGQQYMTNAMNTNEVVGANVAGIWQMRSNLAVPVAAVGDAHNWPLLNTTPYDSLWQGISATKGDYSVAVLAAWTDTDNDQQVDVNEVTMKKYTGISLGNKYTGGVTVGSDMSIITRGGAKLACSGYTAAGAPIYNASNATIAADITYPYGLGDGGGQALAGANNWVVATNQPISGYQSGTLKWTYPNESPGMDNQEHYFLQNDCTPQDILYATLMTGVPMTVNSNVGEIFGVYSATGRVHLFTTDGIYIGTLMNMRYTHNGWVNDIELNWASPSPQRGMDMSNISPSFASFFTTMFKAGNGNFYIAGGGEQTGILRVDGLSTMARLSWGSNTYTDISVSNANQTSCADGFIAREAERQQNGAGRSTLVISTPSIAPSVDGMAGTNEYANWADVYDAWPYSGNVNYDAKAAMAIANGRLYICFTGNGIDPTNSGSDWRRLFRTGGGFEVSIGTNAAASTTRTTPVDGDIRLVVARKADGTVMATLYKQEMTTPSGSYSYNNGVRSVTLDGVSDVSSKVTMAGSEFSIALSDLGWTPSAGTYYLGDISIFNSNDGTTTVRKESWNSKAPGAVADECSECQSYPQTWGRFLVGGTVSVSLTAPSKGATVNVNTATTVSATATNVEGSITKVGFYQNDTLISEDTSSPYSISWTPTQRGPYGLYAKAYADSGDTAVSSTIGITVSDGSSTPTFTQTGLQLWLKANAITGLSDGGSVATWSDSSGAARNATQATATKQPMYVETGHRGMPVVRFDGNNDVVDYTRMTDVRTVFWVVKEDPNAVDGYKTLLGDSSSYDFHRGDGKVIWGGWTALEVRQGVTRINATAITTDPYPTQTVPTSMSIIALRTTGSCEASCFGDDRNFGRGWHGDLSELLVYNRALTDTEMTEVENYLDYKYFGGTLTNQAPSVSITAPANNATYTAPANVTITATASDSDGTVSKVDFYQGATLLGTDSTSPYSYTWTNVAANTYNLTAKATDDDSAETTSSAISITVNSSGGSIPTNGLQMWLKADAITGLSDGAAVGTWTDSSSAGRNATQATANNKPTYKTSIVNGKPVVRFDGSSDFMDFSRMTDVRTVFWVLKEDPAAADGLKAILGDSTNYDFHRGNSKLIWGDYTSYDVRQGVTRINGTAVTTWPSTAQTVPTSWSVVTLRTAANCEASKFGDERSSGYYWQGDLAELIVYNRALTDTELTDVESYLSGKYLGTGNAAPTCSISSPSNNATFTVGNNITIDATASDSDGTVSKVDFYQGTTLLGTDSTSPYSYTWTNAAVGTYSLTAKATDNGNAVTTSTAVNITVNSSASIPTNGLQLWLKADAISGLSDGDAVGTWTDSSSAGRNATQATANNKPTYKTNIVNSKPVVRFDGSSDFMDFSRMTDVRTVFWVLKEDPNAVDGYKAILGDSTNYDFHRGNSKLIWGDYTSYDVRQGVTRINGTAVTTWPSTTQVVPTSWSVVTLRTTANCEASKFGDERSQGAYWQGDLAELIIYNRALSDTELSDVEGYLRTKYNTP